MSTLRITSATMISTVLASVWLAHSAVGYADPLRRAADQLIEASPTQQSWFEYTSPAIEGDNDDLAAADKESVTTIETLEKALVDEKNEYKIATQALDAAKRVEAHAAWLRHTIIRKYLKARDKAWTGQAPAQPKLDLTAVRAEIYRKANLLRDVVPNLTRAPEQAELTWLLATAMSRVGNDHAQFHFDQIQSRFDNTPFALIARVNQADWAFDKGQYPAAIASYKELLGKTKDDTKAYVAWRLAWGYLASALKPAKPDKDFASNMTLASKALILTVLSTKDRPQPNALNLRDEAAFDLAWVWAYQNNETDAAAFFAKNEMPELMLVFREKQAIETIRRREFDKGIALWRAIAEASPLDRSIPDIRLRVCDALIAKADFTALRAELDALNTLTTVAENPWYVAWDGKPEFKRAKAIHKSLTRDVGKRMYDVAMAETDPARRKPLLEATVTELDKRLKASPKDADAPLARFTLAFALNDLGKTAESLAQVEEVIKAKPADPEFLAQAHYQRVILIDTLDRAQKYPALPEAGRLRQPRALPELKTRMAAAADEFLTLVPSAPIATALRYQVASDLFMYGHYEDSLKRLEALVAADPRSEQARSAIEIMLPFLGSRKNWDELLRVSTDLLNNRNVRGKELRDFIREHRDYAKERVKSPK